MIELSLILRCNGSWPMANHQSYHWPLTTGEELVKTSMQSYKELDVWKISIELVVEIYRLTKLLPSEEKYGLKSQMRRCSILIPSNIAEGYGRKNRRENAQFVNIAFGSGTELETQIIIVKKLNLINHQEFLKVDQLLDSVLRMLYRYRESLYR
jgi:four helix bundle protein